MDTDVRSTRTCQKCQQVVPLQNVRLFPQGREKNILVCQSCLKILKDTGAAKKPIRNTPRDPPDQKKELMTYFCSRCNSSFRADVSSFGTFHNLTCPHCGKGDRVRE